MGPNSITKDPRLASVLNRGTLVVIMQIVSLVREESRLAKRIRSLQSAIYRVNPRLVSIESISEQRLVNQANTIGRNSWMTELEIKELEMKVTGSDTVIEEEARSVVALPDHVGQNVKCFAGNGSRRAG